MTNIVKIQVRELEQLLTERKIKVRVPLTIYYICSAFSLLLQVNVTDDAQKWLADEGYDPMYGARPLKRLFQRAVYNPLARLMLGK